MNISLSKILCLSAMLLLQNLYGQEENHLDQASYHWSQKDYGTAHGLPHPEVAAISKITSGELLVGHSVGLSLFNGKGFDLVLEKNGQTVGRVRNIKNDNTGKSWIGSDRGLFYLQDNVLSKIKMPDTIYYPIFQIEPVDSNTIFISTNAGLYKLQIDLKNDFVVSLKKIKTDLSIREIIFAIEYNSDLDLLALGTFFTVVLIDEKSIRPIWRGKSRPSVRTLNIIDKNKIFIGTRREGAWQYDNGKISKILPDNSYVTAYLNKHNEKTYLASDYLYLKQESSKSFERLQSNFEPDNGILSFLALDDHNLFIGSRNGLSHVYSNPFVPAEKIVPSIPTKIVSNFTDESNSIWLGSNNGNIYKETEGQFSLVNQDHITDSDVLSLFKKGKTLFAGSSFEGILSGNDKDWNVYSTQNLLKDNTIRFIKNYGENCIITGGDSYINLIYSQDEFTSIDSITSLSTKPSYSNYLYYNSSLTTKAHFLLSTNEGLFELNEDLIEKITIDSFVNEFEVKGLAKSNHGFYLFTAGNGMFHILEDANGELSLDSSFSALRSKGPISIQAIFQDSRNNIWIADYNALWLMSTERDLYHFDKYDGYWDKAIGDINFLETEEGNIWLMSNSGTLIINPKQLLHKNHRSLSTQLFINGKEHEEQDPSTYTFKHNQNSMSYELKVSDPIANQNNFYAYKLEPLKQEWTYTSNGKIQFDDLSPREYTFSYKASNQANLSKVVPSRIKFIIKKPIHKSNLALLFYALGFLAIIKWATDYQNKLKAKELIARKEKEFSKFQSNFFTQISHDFRTPLAVIKATSDNLNIDLQAKEVINRNSDRLLNMVNQILEINMPTL